MEMITKENKLITWVGLPTEIPEEQQQLEVIAERLSFIVVMRVRSWKDMSNNMSNNKYKLKE